jgi:hypothetical protein
MQDDDNSKSAVVRYGLCLAGVWKVGHNLAPTHQRPSVLTAAVAHPHSPPSRTAPSFPTAFPVVPRTSSSSRPP